MWQSKIKNLIILKFIFNTKFKPFCIINKVYDKYNKIQDLKMDIKLLFNFLIIYMIVFFGIDYIFNSKKSFDCIKRGDLLEFASFEKRKNITIDSSGIEKFFRSTNSKFNEENFLLLNKNENIKVETNGRILEFNEKTASPIYCAYKHPLKKENISIFDFRNKKNSLLPLSILTDEKCIFKIIKNEENIDFINLEFLAETESLKIIKKYKINKNNFLINCSLKAESKNNEKKSIRLLLNNDISGDINLSEFNILNAEKKISKLNKKKVEDFVSILPPLFAISNNLSVNSILQSNISKNDIFERCFFYKNNENINVVFETAEFNDNIEGEFEWYSGPKDYSIVKTINQDLVKVLNFGFMNKIASFLIKIISFIYSIIKNLGISIIAFAILIRLILFPLSYYSKNSEKKREEFTKKYQQIEFKYKDDLQRKQLEQFQLIKEYGVGTMFGGFGMIVNIVPIFLMIALQNGLRNSFYLYKMPFMLWMDDISLPDKYKIFPITIALLSYFQISKTAKTPMWKVFFVFLSVLSFFIFSHWPVGILLYMIVMIAGMSLQKKLFNF